MEWSTKNGPRAGKGHAKLEKLQLYGSNSWNEGEWGLQMIEAYQNIVVACDQNASETVFTEMASASLWRWPSRDREIKAKMAKICRFKHYEPLLVNLLYHHSI